MSIHPSLRGVDNLRGERSVLKRVERVHQLAKDRKIDTDKVSAWGLPKVRTKFKVVSAKKAKAEDATAEAATAEDKPEEAAEEGKS